MDPLLKNFSIVLPAQKALSKQSINYGLVREGEPSVEQWPCGLVIYQYSRS